MKNIRKDTPSEFYRMRRPENFSDSETIYDVVLPKEQLAYELAQISTYQKQDEFENLCRKLVEKLITPNLIPQVGPTGGGDGKTDSETYSVSTEISNRWFIPENGWTKNEKWAFAFSAKETWKSKAESDIKKIISTERDYTKIYFITNQTPSSKKKKEAQDQFIEKFGVDIVILDGIWILEKVIDNKLFEIVVDSLNLSDVYKSKQTIVGSNDAGRNKILQELEDKIQNPNRYSEFDFQLVEDSLESAILSRKLEKPRDEIEGKFDRAFRLCKRLNRDKQWIRLYYQRAWTYLYYFDDFAAFIDDFKEFKKYISRDSSISEIELYVNLFNSLRGFCESNCDLTSFQINISKERKDLYEVLDEISFKEDKPCSSLIAKVYKSIEKLMDSAFDKEYPDHLLKELSDYFPQSIGLIDFPFESFKKMIEEIGIIFPNNAEYDNLIDVIASIEEKRSSELSAGQTFLRRGVQKFTARYYKESIIYFGKAVLKLAKEESGDGLYISLKSLGHAFNEMGLIWASNNCFISASSISFKSWYEKGLLDRRVYDCAKHLVINEQLIGRIPNFLAWHELFHVVASQIEEGEETEEIPIFELLDACLAVRLLNTNYKQDPILSYLPDMLESQNLWLSQNAVLFKLGFIELIINDYKGVDIKNENELNTHFQMVASQPFRNQILYETNCLFGTELHITSKILGCIFNFTFKKDIELLLAAETFAAFFESFLATSMDEICPHTEEINIKLLKNNFEKLFQFSTNDSSSEYQLEINKFSFHRDSRDSLWLKMMELTGQILTKHFFIKNPANYLENLFKKEELNERLSFIFEHRNFTINVLGNDPKLFFDDWYKIDSYKEYKSKRFEPLVYSFKEEMKENSDEIHLNSDQIGHDKRKIVSIIDDNLWNQAKWRGFGPFYDPIYGFGLFIGFENGVAGKAIFENWIKKFGKEDINEIIKITIVKGTNKQNPFWYRVHITSDIVNEFLKLKESYFGVTARFHEMTPKNSINLDRIVEGLKISKKFSFCPAMISKDGSEIVPYFDKIILKQKIEIKNAWEIGFQDIEGSVIKKGDDPIIPDNIVNAPVLELLKKINKSAY